VSSVASRGQRIQIGCGRILPATLHVDRQKKHNNSHVILQDQNTIVELKRQLGICKEQSNLRTLEDRNQQLHDALARQADLEGRLARESEDSIKLKDQLKKVSTSFVYMRA